MDLCGLRSLPSTQQLIRTPKALRFVLCKCLAYNGDFAKCILNDTTLQKHAIFIFDFLEWIKVGASPYFVKVKSIHRYLYPTIFIDCELLC